MQTSHETHPIRARLHNRIVRLLLSCLDGIIGLAIRLGVWRSGPRSYKVIPDIPYIARCAHPSQQLDIYKPAVSGPLPIVMYIHGGGFSQLSRKTHISAAHSLANRGYLVFMVDYRRAPEEPYPSAPHDVSMAYSWIARHAHLYGGDTNRLHLAGESAGGNLVCSLVIGACFRRPEPWMQRVWETNIVPRSWHPLCAYLKVTGPEQYSHWRTRSLMGRIAYWLICTFSRGYLQHRYQQQDEQTLLADPVRFLKQHPAPDRALPPAMISVGNHDVIRRDTADLEAALQQIGHPPHARYYPGEVHGFQLLLSIPAARRFWDHYQQFLQAAESGQPALDQLTEQQLAESGHRQPAADAA